MRTWIHRLKFFLWVDRLMIAIWLILIAASVVYPVGIANGWWESIKDPFNAITAIGTGLVALFSVSQLHQSKMGNFQDVFRDCNSRYDAINEGLGEIVAELGQWKKDDEAEKRNNYIEHGVLKPVVGKDEKPRKVRDLLIDYFNLCAEEYLYYTRGMILVEAWRSWCNGMRARPDICGKGDGVESGCT